MGHRTGTFWWWMGFGKGLNQSWSQCATPGQGVPFMMCMHRVPRRSGNGANPSPVWLRSRSAWFYSTQVALGPNPHVLSICLCLGPFWLLLTLLLDFDGGSMCVDSPLILWFSTFKNPLQMWGSFLLNRTLPGLSWRDGRQRGKGLPLLAGRVISSMVPLYLCNLIKHLPPTAKSLWAGF